ncbi:oxytocin receptor-like [Lytechinus variegatus]|uniref:oxytocin receptor-like n=1 Tax=Lytechinus variegatus TaxID=7654 RepID=UPI001BB25263|nr:oxytocin receptor-like [Lytechinus variegatus]
MDGLPSSIYTTFVLFIQVIAPLFIMFAAYTAIFAKIRRESSKGLSINDAEDNLSQQHKARSRLFMRAQQRTLRMIITIFLAFVVNWTPYVLAAMKYTWHHTDHPDTQSMRIVYETAFLFGLSNSCFNPLVYGCCNLHYFDSFCASCCAVFIGRPDSSLTDHKTSTYTMRWSMKSSPTAKQGYGHHHPHHNNSVNRHGNHNQGSSNNQWIKGRLLTEGAVSSTSQVTVS